MLPQLSFVQHSRALSPLAVTLLILPVCHKGLKAVQLDEQANMHFIHHFLFLFEV